jgi:hypothetical protein
MMHPATESTTPSGGSTCSSSNRSSSNELVRSLEQGLFVLLSHVVVAESDEDKAMHVRRLVGGTRRLEEALGIVATTSESTAASSDDGSFVEVTKPPVALLSVDEGVANESSTIDPGSVRAENLPEDMRPIKRPKEEDEKEEDEEDTEGQGSLVSGKKTRVVAWVEIHAGEGNTEVGDFSVVVKDYRGSSNRIEVADAGRGSWRITIPNDSSASEGVETIEDDNVCQKLRSVAEEATDHGLVLYKGKMVPVDIKPVLSHIVDDWNDHFSSTGLPDVTMNVVGMCKFECVRANEYRWHSNVSFTYAIRGESLKSDIFAMDGIYFDLVRNTNDKYGNKWIKIYIPDSTWLGFQSQFRNRTLWAPCTSGTTKDEIQRLHCITAPVGEDAKIYDVVFCRNEVADTSASCADGVSVRYRGSLQELYNSANDNAVYKGTGFFSLSVTTVDHYSSAPKADGLKQVNLQFYLASARFFGVSNEVSAATFGIGKTRMYF